MLAVALSPQCAVSLSGKTLSAVQGLAPAARVFVGGNPGLCGGVPRPVLPLLGPLNGTSLAYPCFASPTLLPLAADATKVTLSASNQVTTLKFRFRLGIRGLPLLRTAHAAAAGRRCQQGHAVRQQPGTL